MKMKAFTMLSVLIFMVGLVGYAMNVKQKSATAGTPRLTAKEISRLLREAVPARAFKATQIEFFTDSKGSETVRHIRIRQTKEDGSWSEVWRSVGREGETLHRGNPQTGEHTWSKGANSMVVPGTEAGGPNDNLYRNREFLKRLPAFHGTDRIAGLDACVLRSESPDKPGAWIETAHAAETGSFNLRVVYHMADGSEVRIETVRVEFE